LAAAALLLLLVNLGYRARNRATPPRDMAAELIWVKLQMAVDLGLLMLVLHASGGVENPFQFIVIIHVFIASLLLRGGEVYRIAALAGGLYTLLALGENRGWLTHHHLVGAHAMTHETVYVLMSLGAMWLVLLAAALIGSQIMAHNRAIRDELLERQRGLEKAAEAQVDFFRFVTHEVKSPIVTAQSAVEAGRELGAGALPPEADDLLGRAVARLQQALAIVKDLAELTRGRMGVPAASLPVDLCLIAKRALADQAETMAARGLRAETDGLGPVTVLGDEAMLERVVGNLVGNAVRYNRDGGAVRVRTLREGRTVKLQVADDGIGIAPEDLERVFEEFYRSAAARQASTLGTGLGLTIARRFAERMGGTLSVTSRPGAGATFTLALPAAPEQP
ncbi:HAMP domain-containing histidine kinase, partial [bacterium]|nr:HAMP domain-containing histidine kinase [bacterium]